jgi:hypothetical protein
MIRAATAAIVLLPLLAGMADAGERRIYRDCHPYNGPVGYYGNPWCDGGYLYDHPGPLGLKWEYSWNDDVRHGRLKGPRRAHRDD